MKKFILVVIIIIVFAGFNSCIEKKVTGKEETADITCSFNKVPEDIVFNIEDGLSSLIFDGLFINKNGEIENSLCSSYYILDDNKTYYLTIKKGIVYSSGNTINAVDFKAYFEFLSSEGFLTNISSITAEDLNTLRIVLKKEDKDFIKKLADPIFFLRNINDIDLNPRENYNKLSYSGPFVINLINDKYILLEKNKFYNNPEIKTKSIKILIEPLDEMALALFNEGNIDILATFISSESGEKINIRNAAAVDFASSGIFESEEQRRALLYQLKKSYKLPEKYDWLFEYSSFKDIYINNDASYKKTINVFCQDVALKPLGEKLVLLLSELGYKAKIGEAEEKSQILIKYIEAGSNINEYPLIAKKLYLYNKGVEGYYINNNGNLVLTESYKKLP